MMATAMQIPSMLQQALGDGRVIPFVGVGVSRAVVRRDDHKAPLFPSWWELLDRGARSIEAERPRDALLVRTLLDGDEPEYLEAARRLRAAMPGRLWSDLLKQQIDPRRQHVHNPSLALARAVWDLGSQLVITTNYDRVLDWACPERDDLVRLVNDAPAELAEIIRGPRDRATRPTVWYLHGHIDNVDSLVLTPDGYQALYASEEFEHRYRAALAAIEGCMATHTLLFVGFSMADEYVGTTLRAVFERFAGYAGTHYALLPAREVAAVKRQQLPVTPLAFDDFAALPEILRELGRQSAITAGVTEATGTTKAVDRNGASAPGDDSPEDENPFGAVLPILTPERFIGRANELGHIHRLLKNGWLALTGGPKIGKTSLLYRLAHTWQGGPVLGPVDLQSLDDFADFCHHVADELNLAGEDWRTVRKALRKHGPLLLLLDEVDCGPGRCLDGEHLGRLRSLVNDNPELRVVTAARKPVKQAFPDTGTGSPAYNYLQPYDLGEFSDADAKALLAHPWAPHAQSFTESQIAELLDHAGRHPFWLQRAAHHRYANLRNAGVDWRTAWQRDRDHMQ